jgi:hypothetical protein
MAAAAAYVFRPNDELIEGAVKRLFGVDPPKSDEEDE